MARYLILWTIDETRVPVSAKERAAMWEPFVTMVEQDQAKGISKDWGSCVGEMRGYSVAEGTEVEIANMLQQYVPFVHFEVHPAVSTGQVREVLKSLAQ